MLSRLLYKASVLIISKLGLYTLRYVMYVSVLVKVASLLKFRGAFMFRSWMWRCYYHPLPLKDM